jgi:stearoyl-CoA desaturase (delta-9 desaturase)
MNSIIFVRFFYLLAGLVSLYFIPWHYALLGYVFVAMCNGVAAHRYFSHDQFKVNTLGRWLLGFFATIGMYSPINYWIVQHKHHHRHSDKDADLHSPNKGILHSALLWPFKANIIQSAFNEKSSALLLARANRDLIIRAFSKYFILINLVWLVLLLCIDQYIAFAYLAGYLLDYIRIGMINSLCHLNIIGSYKNHQTQDQSYNNIILGVVTLGFGWHNNHHNDAGRLILTEKWWEFDLEGYVGLVLSKIFKYQ